MCFRYVNATPAKSYEHTRQTAVEKEELERKDGEKSEIKDRSSGNIGGEEEKDDQLCVFFLRCLNSYR